MMRFENISKSYGNKKVLDDITCTIKQGAITSLIGPNGAGKSTLLSILSRLDKSDKGGVYLDNKELHQYDNKELAKHLSILRQANNIDLRLTIKDLVTFGRFPYSKAGGRLNQFDHDKIQEALEFSDLLNIQNEYIDELSGGQRQRAFIAMIIAQDTEYILLDEPLNNLDMKHSVFIMKTLRRLADELKKTIIIVIHEINFAAQYSDEIIVMKKGKIVYHDQVHEAIQAEKLEAVFEIPFDIINKHDRPLCNYFKL